MPGSPDDKTVCQADFDRLAETNRDGWRKWERRSLVRKERGGYTRLQVLQGLALSRLERVGGLDVVVQCWEDIREDLVSSIHQPVLDVIVDPGTSEASKPKRRAYLSVDDATTARLARAAERPIVISLAAPIAAAQAEFTRIVERAHRHGDRGTAKGSPQVAAGRK